MANARTYARALGKPITALSVAPRSGPGSSRIDPTRDPSGNEARPSVARARLDLTERTRSEDRGEQRPRDGPGIDRHEGAPSRDVAGLGLREIDELPDFARVLHDPLLSPRPTPVTCVG